MEKSLLALAMCLMLCAPVFAESSSEICREEALEAGLTDQEEVGFYVKECVAQMNGDMEAERTEVEEGSNEEVERGTNEEGSNEEVERGANANEEGSNEEGAQEEESRTQES